MKTGSYSQLFFNAYDFEIRHINGLLKRLKQQAGALQFRLRRLEEQLAAREATIPSAVFGGKKRFQSRRHCETAKQKKRWKEDFSSARNKRMRISGRKDAKHGNFVFLYNEQSHTLYLTLPNRKVVAFADVRFPYGQALLDETIQAQRTCPNKKVNGKAIAWELEDHGGYYVIKAIIEIEPNPHTNYSRTTGVIGIDCNVDCFSWCDVSADGNYLASGHIRFPIAGKRSGQVTKAIEAAAINVVRLAKDANKPIALEKLDTTLSRTGDRYGNKKANRMKSLFASRKMAASVKARADKEGVAVFDVHPTYTSVSGKFKHMRRLGISVHESAGLTIGRRALGYNERVPRFLHTFVADRKKTNHHWAQWHDLNKKIDLLPEKIRHLYNMHQPLNGLSLDHLLEMEQLKIRRLI
ncbi:IS200/IS605 family element transposase accessory protein TnpB [Planococcus lenghuensis]|uniref:IS200/IS605 family element transposase accessory protein TnpB n=1 Tax=Planococcus lenghuensis TaxID=2213202 RepID=UPI000986827E|nr:IS200/IS605 family element transposase accessory protein TnpB [Planococcus lenghuensis]